MTWYILKTDIIAFSYCAADRSRTFETRRRRSKTFLPLASRRHIPDLIHIVAFIATNIQGWTVIAHGSHTAVFLTPGFSVLPSRYQTNVKNGEVCAFELDSASCHTCDTISSKRGNLTEIPVILENDLWRRWPPTVHVQ
ncbi:hypothetical protein RvY_00249-3 [Ramazzottius varieornatus]|uniref:Uncharacterized protein n=1 Tax=Ramazzottius varieornatus TaxID=947166 RepID=A0A1D1UM18_RAMVA|nr:hypothetical protein RvY_00249-3 [Ramazzottius varieornatus]